MTILLHNWYREKSSISRQNCHPDRSAPGFHVTRYSPTPACAAFNKKSRMKFANATKFDRKSGVAERSDLQFALMEQRDPEAIRPRNFCCAGK
jgi:hypothetical protein